MAFIFTVTDNDAHSATVSKSVIGRAGEAGEVMTVNISSTLGALGYPAYMHFLLPNGDSVYKGPYVCSTNTFSVTIGATDNVLAYEGNLVIQMVLQNGTTVVWKSEEKTVKVNPSVNATSPATPDARLWVEVPTSFVSGNVAGYNPTTGKLTDLGIKGSSITLPWINVKDYGAVGDGITDDTVAIQYAISAGQNQGGAIIFLDNKTYFISNTLTLSNNIHMLGNNCTIKMSEALPMFTAAGAIAMNSELALETNPNKTRIKIVDIAGLNAGMIITLRSDALWYYDNRSTLYKGETHLVKAVVTDGADYYADIDGTTWDSYIVPTETVTVVGYNTITIRLSGINMEYPAGTDTAAMIISYCNNAIIEDCSIINSAIEGIAVNYCYNTHIRNSRISMCNKAGYGYGIQDSGSFATIVSDCIFHNCRRGVDFSGTHPSRWGVVEDCYISVDSDTKFSDNSATIYSDSSGFGTHGPAEHISFINNKITNVEIGIYIRSANMEIYGNKFTGSMASAIVISYGTNVRIFNNVVDSNLTGKTSISSPNMANYQPNYFVQILSTVSTTGYIHIFSNICNTLKVAFVYCSVEEMQYLMVYNNDITLRATSSLNDVYVIDADGVSTSMKYSTFINNNYHVIAGVFTYYKGTIDSYLLDYCEYDQIELPVATTLVKWGGTGTLANIVGKLIASRKYGVINIDGYVGFDAVDNTVQLSLYPLPQHLEFKEVTSIIYGAYVVGTIGYNAVNTQTTRRTQYISSDNTAYSTAFSAATGYLIPVHLSYNYYDV